MHVDSLPPHKAFWGLGITVFLPIRPNFIVRVRRTSSWYTKMFCLSFPFAWLSPLSLSVESGAEAGCAMTASKSPMQGAVPRGFCSVGPSNTLLWFFFSSWEGHGVVISSAAHDSGTCFTSQGESSPWWSCSSLGAPPAALYPRSVLVTWVFL